MTTDLFSLAGRSALVTGGSRGIGRMIASGFLKAGARVYISSRKAAACDATAAELAALGPCVSLPADLSTQSGILGLVAAYSAREPHLDILVNNAGAAWGAAFDEFPESGWDKVVDLNLKSPFFLTQALHGAVMDGAARAIAQALHAQQQACPQGAIGPDGKVIVRGEEHEDGRFVTRSVSVSLHHAEDADWLALRRHAEERRARRAWRTRRRCPI